MPERANYCGWEEAYKRFTDVDPDELTGIQKVVAEKNTDNIVIPEGAFEQKPVVVNRILDHRNLERSLQNMSQDDFRKMESGEYSASPVIREAVKRYFGIDLPEKYATQPQVIVTTAAEAKDASIDNF